MTVRQGKLAATIAGMLLGIGAAGVSVPMEPGPLSTGQIARAPPPAAPFTNPDGTEGFDPALCVGEPPPAELLTLAAWPLNPNGSGCDTASSVVFEPLAVEPRYAEVVERGVQRRRAPVVERPVPADRGVVVTVLRGFGQADAAGVEVVERSWTRRDAAVAEGEVLVRLVPQPEAPIVLARVVERGWVRDDPELLASSCESMHGSAAAPGRCVVPRPEAAAGLMPAGAAPDGGEPLVIAGATPVGDDVMDRLRGGFVTPGGLVVSFGIERVVYVNGVLSSTTTLNVADLDRIVGGHADVSNMVAAGTTIGLIQNGPNNTFVGDVISSGAIATVIQNTLDNQHIQTITTINTQVNSLEMMRANRFGQTLRDALNFR